MMTLDEIADLDRSRYTRLFRELVQKPSCRLSISLKLSIFSIVEHVFFVLRIINGCFRRLRRRIASIFCPISPFGQISPMAGLKRFARPFALDGGARGTILRYFARH